MYRMEKAEQAIAKLYGDTAGALRQSDPEFAAIKERLIYGEIYAEERLDAGLRELLILVVAVTNQTMHEVRRHVRAALRCGVPPQQIREAVYQCAPYIGLGKTEAAVEVASETLADSGIPLPLPSVATRWRRKGGWRPASPRKKPFSAAPSTRCALPRRTTRKIYRIIFPSTALATFIPVRGWVCRNGSF